MKSISEESNKRSLFTRGLIETISGFAGGSAKVIIGTPFDLMRVRLQNQNAQEAKKAENSYQILKKIIKTEGFRALYKGALMPLVFSGVNCSVLFTSFRLGKKIAKVTFLKIKNLEKFRLPEPRSNFIFWGRLRRVSVFTSGIYNRLLLDYNAAPKSKF